MAKRSMRSRASGVLNKVFNFELLGQPVGKAVIWSAGFGLSRGLGALVAKALPLEKQTFGGKTPLGAMSEFLLSQIAVAFIVRLKPVRNVIGEKTSSIIAVSAWLDAVNTLFPVSEVIAKWLDPDASSGILNWFSKKLGTDSTASYGPLAPALKSIRGAMGLEGLGDIDTMVPVERDYDMESLQGLDAYGVTSVEDKLVNIVG